jgi:hypothetical protein
VKVSNVVAGTDGDLHEALANACGRPVEPGLGSDNLGCRSLWVCMITPPLLSERRPSSVDGRLRAGCGPTDPPRVGP